MLAAASHEARQVFLHPTGVSTFRQNDNSIPSLDEAVRWLDLCAEPEDLRKKHMAKAQKSADQEPEHTILNFSYLAIVAID